MDRITLTISSELFDDAQQEASVRRNLSVRALLEEIRREFNLLEGSYVLTVKGHSTPLEADRTLGELSIQTGAELVFAREQRRLRQQVIARGRLYFQAVSGVRHGVLREIASGKEFIIEWQPAVIGRPDYANPASAESLAINLAEFPAARTVSRQHAQLTEVDGVFFIEGLAERNATFVNDEAIALGQRHLLNDGDEIRVGSIVLWFSLR